MQPISKSRRGAKGRIAFGCRNSVPAVSLASLLVAAALLAGCTVGPNYNRPTATIPAKWDVEEPWRESAPKDNLAKGEWWTVFQDDDLNGLEKQALAENQT